MLWLRRDTRKERLHALAVLHEEAAKRASTPDEWEASCAHQDMASWLEVIAGYSSRKLTARIAKEIKRAEDDVQWHSDNPAVAAVYTLVIHELTALL